ncbi:MAG: (deoxy)nucleoside triphosphate pyrophosphohydrolase [Candidatus Acidiferrales bacterium]
MLTVVAGLIQADGKLLVCQRRSSDTFGLLWEFPGGKKKSGESPEDALGRELREELGVPARIGPEVFRTRHQYPELGEPIELIFFVATVPPLEVQNLAFQKMEWRLPHTLSELNFLPADRELIEKLAKGTLKIPH